MAKKIVIASHKGGVGKTTTAKNISAELARRGHRTLLVDVDQQANATMGVGHRPSALPATLNDLFVDPGRDPHTVIVQTDVEGLHLMPGHPSLGNTETGMALQRTDPTAPDPVVALKAILAGLEDDYDYIVVDTPPNLGYMTINALAAADELVVPVAASAYSEEGLARTIEAYEKAVKSYNPDLKFGGILITRLRRTNASANVFEGVSEQYSDRVIQQAIVESTAVDEAEQLGRMVVLYDPASPPAEGYKKVVEILTGAQAPAGGVK